MTRRPGYESDHIREIRTALDQEFMRAIWIVDVDDKVELVLILNEELFEPISVDLSETTFRGTGGDDEVDIY